MRFVKDNYQSNGGIHLDPLTHGLTGAAAAHLISGKEDSRLPFLTGFLSAQLPDLDVLFQLTADPLTGVELHRHFTHSLLFAPVGAVAAAGLFWLIFKKKSPFRKLYPMVLAAWISAVLLDACTSYGTHLLLPLSDRMVSWNLISVADPFVTIGMLVFAGYSLGKRGGAGSVMMLLWLGIFLLFGGIQNYRVTTFTEHFLKEQDEMTAGRYVVKPTIGNQLLWRVTYQSSDSVHTMGVRAGFMRGMQLYPGESALLRTPRDTAFEKLPQHTKNDITRFWNLTDGYMIAHPGQAGVLGDARFSMLPTSLTPLWGIDITHQRDHDSAPFLYFRDSEPEVRKAFLNMLMGRTEKNPPGSL